MAEEPDVTPDTHGADDTQGTDDAEGTDDTQPGERLHDHLAEMRTRPDEMQERLDELGEGIESARRQAEADDLLPTEGDPAAAGPPAFPEQVPRGDEAVETPVDDSEVPPGG